MGARGLRVNDKTAKKYLLSKATLNLLRSKTRAEIFSWLRSQDRQYALAFDGNGNLVNGVSGGKLGVDIPEEFKPIENGELIYSHVGTGQEGGTKVHGYGGAMTPSALEILGNSSWKSITAVGQEGSYTATVVDENKRRSLPGKMRKFKNLTKSTATHKGNWERSYQKEFRAQKALGYSDDRAASKARVAAIIKTFDTYYTRNASKLGIDYKFTKR